MLADLRADFPLLSRKVRDGKPLTYLDSGATAQKPQVVIDAEIAFYQTQNAAVARGAHYLAELATEAFEAARANLADYLSAQENEVVWTPGATAALNLMAQSIAAASDGLGGVEAERFRLQPGDEIAVTEAEHHANLIPWQQLALRTGATLRWIPLGEDGRLDLTDLATIVNERTKIFAFTHVSNVTGAISPVAQLVKRAKEVGAITVLDAVQSAPHFAVNVASLGVDFAALSAHKMLGPTGVGALWGRAELLNALPPHIYGGSAVKVVTMQETTWLDAPQRFEPGTQPVAQAVAFSAALDYMRGLGLDQVDAHDRELAVRLREGVLSIPGVRLLGPQNAEDTIAVAAVVVDGVHTHDVGQYLDDFGVAVRVGHHCAQPLHRKYGVAGSTRASAQVYTRPEDIDLFLEGLSSVRSFFGVAS